MHPVFQKIIDLLLPPRCLKCGKILGTGAVFALIVLTKSLLLPNLTAPAAAILCRRRPGDGKCSAGIVWPIPARRFA